jgi:tripartite-type tricarboxylate transporter receptor subunit TctC
VSQSREAGMRQWCAMTRWPAWILMFAFAVSNDAASAAAPGGASGSGYPARPIRLLVGFSPGGGTDIAVRIIGKKLSETWGQQVVIDNRPGAGGLLAFDMVAKATPDGYTLLAASPSFAIQPNLARKLPYDPIRDFVPVTVATAAPYLMVVYPGIEAKSVNELIALAKANPGKFNYASGGIGSAQHLAAELFAYMAGISMVHVPFKGAVNVPEVIAGRVQMLMSGLPQGLPHVQAGRLRALGVTTRKRSPAVPNVPTIAEAGVPGYDVTVWYGIFATGGTPRPVVDRLYAGFVQALKSADVRQQLTAIGLEPVGNPPGEFAATVRSEIKQWGQVIMRAGIKPE